MTEMELQNLKQQKSNNKICKRSRKLLKTESGNQTTVSRKEKRWEKGSEARLLKYRKSKQC
jgi:hypothetical protein